MTISGAYGRDYKSLKAIKADWDADKDFVIRDVFSGGGAYINRADARAAGIRSIEARYDSDRKVTILKP
jgi:hypothetical protein